MSSSALNYTFAAPGQWKLITSQTAVNSASLSFTGISGAFPYYALIGDIIPATSGVGIWINTSSNNGVSYDTGASDYIYGSQATTTGSVNANISAAFMPITDGIGSVFPGNGANQGCTFQTFIINPAVARYCRIYGDSLSFSSTGAPSFLRAGGCRAAASIVNAVRIMASSGNITSGTIQLYGIEG